MKTAKRPKMTNSPSPLPIDTVDWDRLRAVDHSHPHSILGAHPATWGDKEGVVIRAYHPDAADVQCLLDGGESITMDRVEADGLFAVFIEGASMPLSYRLRFEFEDGNGWERGDPYRFMPTLGDMDLHLFNEGNHRRLWEKLGAHVRRINGVDGVSFAVWAPNATRVSVMGDFCGWDGRLFPMRQMGSSGVFELFIPELGDNTLFKYEIRTKTGELRIKSDPMSQAMEGPPGNASRVVTSSHVWQDEDWMLSREGRDPPARAGLDLRGAPRIVGARTGGE